MSLKTHVGCTDKGTKNTDMIQPYDVVHITFHILSFLSVNTVYLPFTINMETSLEHLKIKQVTDDDEENVLSIRNPAEVYCGLDYLPSCFKRLLKFPNATGYAVLHDTKYVSIDI